MIIITFTHKKEQIIKLTNALVEYVAILESKFNDKTIEEGKKDAFFTYVKKETEEMFAQLDEWVDLLSELNEQGDSVINQAIIESTKDNMNALIMHSYYKDVRRRRYMEINRSCIYTYQSVLKELTDE
ncbi:MAG TPA: DUF1798 family protein [Pseudogracilibacillus sp.]|nr:DUF1798 family protein [Pseudogracilibacillus sp.]